MINFGSVQGQNINEKFDKLSLSENFDSISTYWTTVANAENLFIVQDGEYILQRRATTAPYAIIANFNSEFDNYRLVSSLKLDKSLGENATVGLLFMMQKEGQGGFIVELNKKNEYRLRQIVSGVYRYITGSSKDGGWVKNNAISSAGIPNIIEIKTLGKSYDLTINGVFMRSFSEPNYSKGKIGFIIGAESRAMVDFLYVFTKSTSAEIAASTANKVPDTSSDNNVDVIVLTESIIKLKTQINELQESNNDQKKIISAMKSGDQDKDVTIRNGEKQIKILEDQVKAKEVSIDSLKKINNDLLKYKEMVGGNENGDLIINLSKALKAEKEKNQKLESELKDLKTKSGTPGTAPKPDKTGNTGGGDQGDVKKDTNVFSLPKDK